MNTKISFMRITLGLLILGPVVIVATFFFKPWIVLAALLLVGGTKAALMIEKGPR